MKQRRNWLKLFVVMSLVLSILLLSSCSLIEKLKGNSGSNDQPGDQTGEQPGEQPGGEQPTDKPDENPNEEKPGNDPVVDLPTLSELDAKFYDASNWVYMTNDNGASLDGGDIPSASKER